MTTWFEDIPVAEYKEIAKHSAENVPDESPGAESVGGLNVKCGPILRLLATLEDGGQNYRGSILLVLGDEIDTQPKISYELGPSGTSSSEIKKGEFPAEKVHQERGHVFWRFNIDLTLVDVEQQCQYAINDQHEKSFQFFLPAVDQSMNIVSHSCNGFSLATDTSDYKGSLWLDVLNKHKDIHYHVMLGGGDQIYCDSVKKASKHLKDWTSEANPIKKRSAKSSPELVEELESFYIHHYVKWFGVGYWKGLNGKTLQSLYPIAMHQIPSVNIFDDHDIIDGFGSYKDSTMNNELFSTVGNIAYKYYMLFQHHTSITEKSYTTEKSWILGPRAGPFIKQQSHSNYVRLGKDIGFLGLDCRTERKQKQVVTTPTYNVVFERLKKEIDESKGAIKHLLVLLGVPIAYPRLVWLEWLLTSKLLAPIRTLSQKGIVAQGLVNEFDGSVEVLDDLSDHWCASHHKRERNFLIEKLMDLGAQNGVRISILSGDVHLCCISRFKSKYHHYNPAHQDDNVKVTTSPENDPRLIFNVISSAIVNAPPPDAMATLLNSRSKIHKFDHGTDEDMIDMFSLDVDSKPRNNAQFLNRRNWCDLIPAENSNKYRDVLTKLKDGSLSDYRKFPGSVDMDQKLEVDDENIKYPLTSESLVVTLHVEKDSKNVNAETADYEVLIPFMNGKQTLDHQGIKKRIRAKLRGV